MDDPTPTVDAPSKPPLRFRRTRIAVSVFFGVLTVALCVLWVRSYWRFDECAPCARDGREVSPSILCAAVIFVAIEPIDNESLIRQYEGGPVPISLATDFKDSLRVFAFDLNPVSGSCKFHIGFQLSYARSYLLLPRIGLDDRTSPSAPCSSPRRWWPSCWGSASGWRPSQQIPRYFCLHVLPISSTLATDVPWLGRFAQRKAIHPAG